MTFISGNETDISVGCSWNITKGHFFLGKKGDPKRDDHHIQLLDVESAFHRTGYMTFYDKIFLTRKAHIGHTAQMLGVAG